MKRVAVAERMLPFMFSVDKPVTEIKKKETLASLFVGRPSVFLEVTGNLQLVHFDQHQNYLLPLLP